MYGVSLLKTCLERTAGGLVCPVRGCRYEVPIQHTVFRLTDDAVCPVHKIAISESTFAYQREADNLLWTDSDSMRLLNAAKKAGRDDRLGHDTSERALTWNVFRWLESTDALGGLIEHWTGERVVAPAVVYWSYSRSREGVHFPLYQARTAYHEEEPDQTEPAIIVETDELVVVVDPHLGSVRPAPRGPGDADRYQSGAGGWAAEVLDTPCRELTSDRGQFELLRLWLLGSLMARQQGKRFLLLYLAPAWSSAPVFLAASSRFRHAPERAALRVSWEEIHAFVAAAQAQSPGALALLSYLEEKAAGYGQDGVLRRAFLLRPPVRMTPARA